jgi:ribonuclease P/MRP protein subunit RPP40
MLNLLLTLFGLIKFKFKLQRLNLPRRLLSLFCSFLDDRSQQVWLKDQKSDTVHLRAGILQGSVLSPILYIIFVNDVPSKEVVGVHPAQYADDIGL